MRLSSKRCMSRYSVCPRWGTFGHACTRICPLCTSIRYVLICRLFGMHGLCGLFGMPRLFASCTQTADREVTSAPRPYAHSQSLRTDSRLYRPCGHKCRPCAARLTFWVQSFKRACALVQDTHASASRQRMAGLCLVRSDVWPRGPCCACVGVAVKWRELKCWKWFRICTVMPLRMRQ